MKPLYVQTRMHPEILRDLPVWRRSPPWNIWLVKEVDYSRLTISLRCQGYTVNEGLEAILGKPEG